MHRTKNAMQRSNSVVESGKLRQTYRFKDGCTRASNSSTKKVFIPPQSIVLSSYYRHPANTWGCTTQTENDTDQNANRSCFVSIFPDHLQQSTKHMALPDPKFGVPDPKIPPWTPKIKPLGSHGTPKKLNKFYPKSRIDTMMYFA